MDKNISKLAKYLVIPIFAFAGCADINYSCEPMQNKDKDLEQYWFMDEKKIEDMKKDHIIYGGESFGPVDESEFRARQIRIYGPI